VELWAVQGGGGGGKFFLFLFVLRCPCRLGFPAGGGRPYYSRPRDHPPMEYTMENAQLPT
jgi:hypothetical protein